MHFKACPGYSSIADKKLLCRLKRGSLHLALFAGKQPRLISKFVNSRFSIFRGAAARSAVKLQGVYQKQTELVHSEAVVYKGKTCVSEQLAGNNKTWIELEKPLNISRPFGIRPAFWAGYLFNGSDRIKLIRAEIKAMCTPPTDELSFFGEHTTPPGFGFYQTFLEDNSF